MATLTHSGRAALAAALASQTLHFAWGTGDAAWEVNFDHQYKIYENLTAYLELGYINLDLIRNHFQSDTDDAWKAQVGFKYEF